MSVTLASLKEDLAEDVPAYNGVPSDSQYERAVKDAVRDFANRTGKEKILTLNVISGTATYSLPEGFLKLISIESMANPSGIINSADGLIPISSDWEERYTIINGVITFYPTPAYTLARDFRYKSGLHLDGLAYPDMGEDEKRIVLLKAQSLAWGKVANAVATGGWRYTIGDETVDKSKQGENVRGTIKSLHDEYLEAVDMYIGALGSLGVA